MLLVQLSLNPAQHFIVIDSQAASTTRHLPLITLSACVPQPRNKSANIHLEIYIGIQNLSIATPRLL